MGIYDREYYRREGPSYLGVWGDRGKACKWLIGINIAIFFLQVFTQAPTDRSEEFFNPNSFLTQQASDRQEAITVTNVFILDTAKVWQGQIWRLLTYAFLHDTANIWHIVMNMLFLWWLGSDVEDLYGWKEFVAFYLLAAFAGGLAFLFTENLHTCLSASGAVMAVSVLCAFHYPTRTILVMFVIPVQLWLLVAFYVVYDAWSFLSHAAVQTAVTVHLAGAATGLVYYKAQVRILDFLPNLQAWKKKMAQPRLRVYREEAPVTITSTPLSAAPVAAAEVDEQLEAKLDAVLAKVARYGQNSLTDLERQILFRASEVYKRRRTLDS